MSMVVANLIPYFLAFGMLEAMASTADGRGEPPWSPCSLDDFVP